MNSIQLFIIFSLLTTIVIWIVGIQIVFFVKLWNMTNHIKELRDQSIGSNSSKETLLEIFVRKLRENPLYYFCLSLVVVMILMPFFASFKESWPS